MCNDVVEKNPYALEYVIDLFVTQQQIKILQYDNDDWYDNHLIEWYDGYKKPKVQKIKIKEELMPITWHPSRWWDWCIPEDEKTVEVTDNRFYGYLIEKSPPYGKF